MRLPDPSGDWKISSLDPRLMEKRAPTRTAGRITGCFSEGLIEDYDGYLIKDARPLEGLDFNRNFPFEWRTEGEQHGAGPYPASEPEIRAVVDFVAKHPNINVAITYHTFSRRDPAPLQHQGRRPDGDRRPVGVQDDGRDRHEALTGYRCVSTFHDFHYHPKEVTTGAFDDWMYDHWGASPSPSSCGICPPQAGIEDRKFMRVVPRASARGRSEDLEVGRCAAPGGRYVDWYPFDHPQLGKVELGGWNMLYYLAQPAPGLYGRGSGAQLPFMLSLAEMLPHLAVRIP